MGESYSILACVDSRFSFEQLPLFSGKFPPLPEEATRLKIDIDGDFHGIETCVAGQNPDDIFLRAIDFNSDGLLDVVGFYDTPFPNGNFQWLILNPDPLEEGFLTSPLMKGSSVFRLPTQKDLDLGLGHEGIATLSLLEDAITTYLDASREGISASLNQEITAVNWDEAGTSVNYYCKIEKGDHSAGYHFQATARCDPEQMISDGGSVEADSPKSVVTYFYRQNLVRVLDGSPLPQTLTFKNITVGFFALGEDSPHQEARAFVDSTGLSCPLDFSLPPPEYEEDYLVTRD